MATAEKSAGNKRSYISRAGRNHVQLHQRGEGKMQICSKGSWVECHKGSPYTLHEGLNKKGLIFFLWPRVKMEWEFSLWEEMKEAIESYWEDDINQEYIISNHRWTLHACFHFNV